MKEYLFMDCARDAYAPEQIHSTTTVRELIDYLREYDEDTPVLFRHDGGYTYGRIDWATFNLEPYEEEE